MPELPEIKIEDAMKITRIITEGRFGARVGAEPIIFYLNQIREILAPYGIDPEQLEIILGRFETEIRRGEEQK